jgi:hypothetical protein
MHEHCYPHDSWSDFLEKLQPFSADRVLEIAKARNMPPGRAIVLMLSLFPRELHQRHRSTILIDIPAIPADIRSGETS